MAEKSEYHDNLITASVVKGGVFIDVKGFFVHAECVDHVGSYWRL